QAEDQQPVPGQEVLHHRPAAQRPAQPVGGEDAGGATAGGHQVGQGAGAGHLGGGERLGEGAQVVQGGDEGGVSGAGAVHRLDPRPVVGQAAPPPLQEAVQLRQRLDVAAPVPVGGGGQVEP